MNHLQKHLSASLIALAALLAAPMGAWAAPAPDLSSFALLSGADPLGGAGDKSLTLTGSTVTGNVGSNGTNGSASVTLTDSIVNGTVYYTGPSSNLVSTNSTITAGSVSGVPSTVIEAFYAAYDALTPVVCEHMLTGPLTNVTLTPGVYCFDAAAAPTGVLTLNGQGNPNAVWIFKIGTGLAGGALSPTDFSVVMAGNGNACNVTWWVADAATIVRGDFKGNILAGRAITATGTAVNPLVNTIVGRAFSGRDSAVAADKSVTMTDIAVTGCAGTIPTPPPPPPSCDKNHKHHKHCKHNDNDKPHCDGDNDGHGGDNDGHGGDNDGHDGGHDGHGDKDGHDSGYHNNPFGSNDDHGDKGGNKH